MSESFTFEPIVLKPGADPAAAVSPWTDTAKPSGMPPTDTHVSGFKHALWYVLDAGWSSLVARRAHNPKVAGSNPAPAMRKRLRTCQGAEAFSPSPWLPLRAPAGAHAVHHAAHPLGGALHHVGHAAVHLLHRLLRGVGERALAHAQLRQRLLAPRVVPVLVVRGAGDDGADGGVV